jgi:acyl-CoA synthetase (NDP forming)/RimJ/RimL family protein N-acetyltransferase
MRWFERHPPKADIRLLESETLPSLETAQDSPPVLIVLAHAESLPHCVEIACRANYPVVILPKVSPERAPRWVRGQLRDLALDYRTRMIGPDTQALVLPHQRFATPPGHFPVVEAPDIASGSIAVLTQSPSITSCIRDWVIGRDIGLSHLICVGGSSDVNIADLVDTLIQDTHCRALVIQIDRLRIPARFISALRSCSRHKPVMVLHTGRVRDFQTEQDPAIDTFLDRELLYQAAINRAGASSLDTLDDLFQALESLIKRRTHDGNRLAIIGAGDGLEALAADHLYTANEGTIDFTIRKEPRWFDAPEQFPTDADTLNQIRESADGVLIPLVAERLIRAEDTEFADWAHRFKTFERTLNRPIYLAAPGLVVGRQLRKALDRAGLAVYTTPEQALNGFLSLARHEFANRLVDAHVEANDLDALTDAERILKSFLPAPAELDASQRRQVADAIPHIDGHAMPQGTLTRLAAGIARDPIFGPVIYVHEPPGHFPKLALTLPPINQALAEDLLHRAATGRTLESTDPEGFANAALVLVNCSRLLSRVPELASLKIQLSIARGQVHSSLNEITLAERVVPAITPYPESLDRPVTLNTGQAARLRPLRPEDETAHRVFLSKLSRATLRFRYFSDKHSFSARELAAMTHVDYSREVALIVTLPGEPIDETLGVVRVIFDADGLSAEFAMVVRDDVQRTGVGHMLLQAAVDLASDRNARLIYGETMIQNRGMQALAKRVGFKVTTDFEAECVWMTYAINPPRDAWEANRLKALTG